jgi:hypothetical protein
MAAIITDTFRRNNAKLFIGDIANRFNTDHLGHYDSLVSDGDATDGVIVHRNKYYLGVGKSDKWSTLEDSSNFTIPSPVGSFSDNVEVLNNLATLTLLGPSNTSIVIPNVPWAVGNIYRAYSSYDSSCFYSATIANVAYLPCYVTIPDDGIYMCLKSPGTATTSASIPSDPTSTYAPIATADGYIWVLVQKFTGFAVEFITDQFVEVRRTSLENSTLETCRLASGGLVTGFNVVNGGTYTGGTPTAWLRGTDGLSYTGLTSETTHSFTAGIKTFVTNLVASATAFDVGQTVKIVNRSNETAYMTGTISSFTSTNLTINVTSIQPGSLGSPNTWRFDIQSVTGSGGGAKDSSFELALNVTMSGSAIASVSLPVGSFPTNISPTTSFPKEFLAASVEIRTANGVVQTSPAQIIPTVTPFNGLGYNPSDVLPSWYAGISVSLNSDINSDNFYTPYRQISIIRNVNASNQITVNALRSLTLNGSNIPTIDVNSNVVMTDSNGRPLAIADYAETVSGVKKIYFHQNSTTGYREMPAPTNSAAAVFKIGSTSYSYTSINQSELSKITTDIHGNILNYNGYSYVGEVVFAENRKKVTRSINQNEKIKIIIQF